MPEKHLPIHRRRLLFVAVLSALFSLALLYLRISYTGSMAYSFLAWNLALAAIPLCLSTLLTRSGVLQHSRPALLGTLGVWILFFPNAPYLMTDLIHLRYTSNAPIWFDVILLVSFASCGLLLGFISLADLERLLKRRQGTFMGNAFVLATLVSAAFGIYLGRFLRWNSWDLLTRPTALLGDIAHLLLHPLSHPKAVAITVFLSVLLSLWYLAFQTLHAGQELAPETSVTRS